MNKDDITLSTRQYDLPELDEDGEETGEPFTVYELLAEVTVDGEEFAVGLSYDPEQAAKYPELYDHYIDLACRRLTHGMQEHAKAKLGRPTSPPEVGG